MGAPCEVSSRSSCGSSISGSICRRLPADGAAAPSPTNCARTRSTITASRGRESSRSSPTKPLSTSATWRSPIRRASRLPARHRATTRRRRRGYTARGNLVAVITNGTAVLGLGDIGPLAAKPVMEGKAVLFKKFAGIDVFDIEIDADAIRTSWSTSSRRSSRPSAASTSRTSRRRSASTSSARCKRAHEDPGLPRRPARHGDHRRRGGAQCAGARRQEHRARSSW